MEPDTSLDVAIVGVGCRFPGAPDVAEFWRNLVRGKESITAFTDAQFLAGGGDPARLADPYLVRAEAAIEGIGLFDAAFFGYPPAEAALLDPQHRLFLECAYHALENAGHDPARSPAQVGVYAGAGQSQYFLRNVYPHLMDSGDSLALQHASLASAGSALATRVSYGLGLTGPSFAVQSACSTSLVAVHLAAADLLAYRCDVALAGGVTLNPTPARGYRYVEDGPFSPDGHCRAFDERAAGMVPGDGVGVVVLKRLDDALADGDHVHAVLKATAVNNDGRRKLGFTAPSISGQVEAVTAAHELAGTDPASIGYIEAHGTATPIGDPIEVAALAEVFGSAPAASIHLGSVKSNIGHTDAAAGVAGLIKAVLSVQTGLIPGTVGFTKPNPLLELDSTPFTVNADTVAWPEKPGPRRAAVNSLGIGGTNVHVVVEQAPARKPSDPAPNWSLLTLSAKTPAALAATCTSLGEWLRDNPAANLGDVAHTLQLGRTALPHRHTVVCRTTEEASTTLLAEAPHLADGKAARSASAVVFLFPGTGAQYAGMGAELYESEPVFRAEIDRYAAIVSGELGVDLRSALYGAGADGPAGELVGPLLVATEYALATLLMSVGVVPQALVGHSVGEYAAACLAGVMSIEDALPLLVKRERLMHRAAGTGGMLSVTASEQRLRAHLGDRLALAAVNGPESCVVSGPADDLLALQEELTAAGIAHQVLVAPAAGHSALLDPVLDEFAAEVAKVPLAAPRLPYISNLTGTWIRPDEATDPTYWVRHFRETVQFGAGLDVLLADGDPVLLEVGPGRVLSKLATTGDRRVTALSSLRHARATRSDSAFLRDALGSLWREGVDVDFAVLHSGARRGRVPLPGYPFDRGYHWIDPPRRGGAETGVGWNRTAARRMAEEERRLRAEGGIERPSGELAAQLDHLCLVHIAEFLRGNGVALTEGAVHRVDDLLAALRMLPRYRKLLVALLRVLDEESVATFDGDRLTLLTDLSALEDSSVLADRIAARFPDYAPDLAFVANAVRHYGEVFRGEVAGNEVLLPDGDDEAQREIIDKRLATSDIVVHRELIARTVARLVREAGGRTVRILEVGAGRGYLSWVVAEALAGTAVEYHFTDVGRSFVLDGQREARERGIEFMEFGVLDVAADPGAQGYPAGGFDLVLAFNVLHVASDLRQAVRNVTGLLAPGGALFVLEACVQQRWSLMSTGLYDGWWQFDDDVRDVSPLISAEAWVRLLGEEGYDEVAAFPSDAAEDTDHTVIVGRVPPTGTVTRAATSTLGEATTVGFNRRPALETEYVAPSAGAEEDIAGIWREVLGLDRVGVHDNFFDLGGESLLAMQIVARVRDSTGVEFSLRKLFDNATVARLVAVVAEGGRAAGAPVITRSARRRTLEKSP